MYKLDKISTDFKDEKCRKPVYLFFIPYKKEAIGEKKKNLLLKSLSDQEQKRFLELEFKPVQTEYLLSKWLSRNILSIFSGKALGDIDYKLGPQKKPELIENPEKLSFNVSHTNELLCLSLSKNTEIGIDIEKLDRKIEGLKIGRRYFTDTEYNLMEKLDEKEKIQDKFLELWTLKESFIKAKGGGLQIPLKDFYFLPEGKELVFGASKQLTQNDAFWTFFQLNYEIEYKCSLAIHAMSESVYEIKGFEINPFDYQFKEIDLGLERSFSKNYLR